jgi:predicted SprT family Zn-dependent metalloprotease
MLLADAEKLALDLMQEFRLLKPKDTLPPGSSRGVYWFAGPNHEVLVGSPWRFQFDDSRNRFGSCHMTRKLITLSREFVLRNSREETEDTIRHEIAHALCPLKEHHGAIWKAMCGFTGAKPERCVNRDRVTTPEGDWKATCGGCGRIYYKHRTPKGTYHCPSKTCKGRSWLGRPILIFKHKNALPDPNAAQRRKAIEAIKARLKSTEAAQW